MYWLFFCILTLFTFKIRTIWTGLQRNSLCSCGLVLVSSSSGAFAVAAVALRLWCVSRGKCTVVAFGLVWWLAMRRLSSRDVSPAQLSAANHTALRDLSQCWWCLLVLSSFTSVVLFDPPPLLLVHFSVFHSLFRFRRDLLLSLSLAVFGVSWKDFEMTYYWKLLLWLLWRRRNRKKESDRLLGRYANEVWSIISSPKWQLFMIRNKKCRCVYVPFEWQSNFVHGTISNIFRVQQMYTIATCNLPSRFFSKFIKLLTKKYLLLIDVLCIHLFIEIK